MPVRKFTSLREAEDACWYDRDDPGLWRAISAVWAFSRRVAPRRYAPGVHKARSIEELNLWTRRCESEASLSTRGSRS